MRKISKTRFFNPEQHAPCAEAMGTRPGRITGAKISAWSGSLAIDLGALFARRPAGLTIGGGSPPDTPAAPVSLASCPPAETVSLSDGTKITFATASQFDTVNSM